MIVVMDTNVLVSSLISRQGPPARLIEHWHQHRFALLISDVLLADLRRALAYPRVLTALRRSAADVDNFLKDLEHVVVVLNTAKIQASRDPDDNRFIEAAVAGGADYLVTGDRDLLDLTEYEGIEIVTPARFLAILESTAG